MKKISKIFESNNLLRNKIFVLNFDDEFKTLLHAHKDYHKIKYPPCIAEEKYYIKNISYNYNMLDNLSDEELENLTYIFMKDEKITNFLFDELIKLNKELSIFKDYPFLDEKFYKKSCVIGGVCSKMNINDIKDYIDNGTMIEQFPNRFNSEYKFSRNDGKAIEYSITMNKLYNKGISLEWFPCIDTMVNILNQI